MSLTNTAHDIVGTPVRTGGESLNNFHDRDGRKTKLCDNVFDNALYAVVSKEAIGGSSNTGEV
jgi:hypothetical protein